MGILCVRLCLQGLVLSDCLACVRVLYLRDYRGLVCTEISELAAMAHTLESGLEATQYRPVLQACVSGLEYQLQVWCLMIALHICCAWPSQLSSHDDLTSCVCMEMIEPGGRTVAERWRLWFCLP